jgi:hypothetical protein
VYAYHVCLFHNQVIPTREIFAANLALGWQVHDAVKRSSISITQKSLDPTCRISARPFASGSGMYMMRSKRQCHHPHAFFI